MKTQKFVITLEYGEKDDCGNPIPPKTVREIRCAIGAYIDATITVDEITKSNRSSDTTQRSKKMSTKKEKTYPVFCRACYLHDGKPDTSFAEYGKVYNWTMEQILAEINCDRSKDWTPYNRLDWQEGLDEWTWYHPITVAWEGHEEIREYDNNGRWRLIEIIANQFGDDGYWKDAPFRIRMNKGGEDWNEYKTLEDALKDYACIDELYGGK